MAILTGKDGFVYTRLGTYSYGGGSTVSSVGNIYQINPTGLVPMDPLVTPTINATALTYLDRSYGFNGFDYFTAKFHLTTATTPTIVGSYITMTALADILNWSIDVKALQLESTSIGLAWKTFTVAEKSHAVTIRRWFSSTDMTAVVIAGQPLILQLYYSATTGIWMMGYIQGLTVTIQRGAIQDEALTFIGQGFMSNF